MAYKDLFSNIFKTLEFSILYWKCSRLEIYHKKLNLKLIAIITTTKQLLFIIGWAFLFDKYSLIGGWGVNEMLIMFSIVSFGVAIVEIFFYGIRDMNYLIDSNQIDILLIRPKNILFMIGASKINILALGDLISSIILLICSGYLSQKSFVWIFFFYILSCIFILALYILIGSLSFFVKNSDFLIKELYRVTLFLASQPNSIYKGLLKVVTMTILPVAYLSFYPVEFIIKGNPKLLLYSCLGTFIFLCGSILTFQFGLKKYIS